jgi:hypothetical protein
MIDMTSAFRGLYRPPGGMTKDVRHSLRGSAE